MRTRKLLTMHNGFHPKKNVERLNLSRSEGGRLIVVQDTVWTAILCVKKLCKKQQREIVNCYTYNKIRRKERNTK